MSDNLYEVDPLSQEEEGKSTKNKIIWYSIMIVGILVVLFLIFWLMLRINYRLNTVRDSRGPIIKWTFIGIVGFVILASIVIFLINILGKKGEYDKHYQHENLEKK